MRNLIADAIVPTLLFLPAILCVPLVVCLLLRRLEALAIRIMNGGLIVWLAFMHVLVAALFITSW